MVKFTLDNAIYSGLAECERIKDMSRERLLELVIELMNEQERTRERHAHERDVLAGFGGRRV